MSLRVSLAVLATVASATLLAGEVDAAKAKRPPVIGVVTEGVAEKLYGAPKLKKNKAALVGKTFTAVCDGAVATWKRTDLGDAGALVGGCVGGAQGPPCLLLDAPAGAVVAAKSRPTPSTAQVTAAKAAALAALTPKKGDAPQKVDVTVFHDGESFVAVAQASFPVTNPKSNCLEHGALVVLTEKDDGAWRSFFRPQAKGKKVCGYGFFTRGDVDGDGRDEIALRVDKEDEYGYRIMKRGKGSYDVIAK
ncbi:MAG: hypothetical protein NVS3B10_08890 [Polyangiales bacterium]